jgi:hypothetical protein
MAKAESSMECEVSIRIDRLLYFRIQTEVKISLVLGSYTPQKHIYLYR